MWLLLHAYTISIAGTQKAEATSTYTTEGIMSPFARPVQEKSVHARLGATKSDTANVTSTTASRPKKIPGKGNRDVMHELVGLVWLLQVTDPQLEETSDQVYKGSLLKFR